MDSKRKILVLAANPEPEKYGHLSLDKEIREIQDVIRSAALRDSFELLQPRVAVNYRDLQSAILRESPQIVHFCGHGSGTQGLLVCDIAGKAKLIDAEALSKLFKLFSDCIECVVLNACYSSEQAEVICQDINYVIGMNNPIGDISAQEFTFGLYTALGNGRSYEFAYEFGCSSISIGGSKKYVDVPKLYRRSLANPNPSLGLYTWVEPSIDNTPVLLLDWTPHYDRKTRQIPSQETWEKILLPDLSQTKAQLRKASGLSYINVQARASLTAILALGYTFPKVDDYKFKIEQITEQGKVTWRSDEPPSELKFQVEESEPGTNFLIAFSITGSAKPDIDLLLRESSESFSVVYCEPESGVGNNAITSNQDATALAIDARRLMQKYIKQYKAKRTHLILYAPQGFCLFLGQKLNSLGEVITYERRDQGGYQIGLIIQTG